MPYEVSHDRRINLVRVRFTGEVSEEEYGQFAEFINSLPPAKKMRYLADISELKMPLWARRTRKLMANKTERIPGSRIAVIGASYVGRMFARAFSTAMGKQEETDFFKNEEYALRWLDGNMPTLKNTEIEEGL
ncbi:STAS/SEC14 domain-containing protein [candidate division WOR-3 bacterium]|nr:STAS/SEC14 domain-containing protein [candidate division WOR-3 bacterium]